MSSDWLSWFVRSRIVRSGEWHDDPCARALACVKYGEGVDVNLWGRMRVHWLIWGTFGSGLGSALAWPRLTQTEGRASE